jgi:hypothetical protein
MGTRPLFSTGIIVLLLASCSSVPVRQQYRQDNCADRTDLYEPSNFLLPGLMAESYALRNYVRSCLPRSNYGVALPCPELLPVELHTVDLIYLHALRVTGGDYTDALAISALAVLTHKNIPFTFGLRFPLTTEGDSLYNERTARLPRMLFSDTGIHGDTDNDLLPDLAGLFVEWGESGLVEQETEDNRDIRANRLGQLFALRLAWDPSLLPSHIFTEWNTRGDTILK